MTTPDSLVVLDFGGQYAHLIANRIRRLHVYSGIMPPYASVEEIRSANAKGIILSGGPASVYDPDAPKYTPEIFDLGIPLLGICYGHQLLCQHFGGRVVPGTTREYGTATLTPLTDRGLLQGLDPEETVWMSHGDAVAELPPGFRAVARTEECPVAAMEDSERRIYGLQFHPEVTHTPHGMRILDNFVDACGFGRDWTPEHFLRTAVEEIARKAGDRRVFLLVSGGVDSTVVFALLNRALGPDRVYGLHVDNGFMRLRETMAIERYMRENDFHNLRVVDASEDFLRAVEGVVDPEEKRRIVGAKFVAVVEEAVRNLGLNADEWLLAQGTLYTDTIESGGTAHAATIKTHHNRVEAVERLVAKGRVIEPLAQLYKDEVRAIGAELGLPEELIWRQPFPGPGLSVRVLCSEGEEGEEDIEDLRSRAKGIAKEFGLNADVWPIRSVGVQGDFRTYARPVALSGEGDWEILEQVSTALTNRIREINRGVYLLRPETLPSLYIKRSHLTRDRLDLLRRVDHTVQEMLEGNDLMREISQTPVVLIPLSPNRQKEIVVLRPIHTEDFMTARFFRIPMPLARDIAKEILRIEPIAAVFYDITHKPPGTTEWE